MKIDEITKPEVHQEVVEQIPEKPLEFFLDILPGHKGWKIHVETMRAYEVKHDEIATMKNGETIRLPMVQELGFAYCSAINMENAYKHVINRLNIRELITGLGAKNIKEACKALAAANRLMIKAEEKP